MAGLLIVEIGLRIADRAQLKSTWLEMHERGFMMNRADTDGLHTHNDIRVRYHLSPQRTRGGVVNEEDINIWVFGDSFTFGLLLEEEDSFVHYLNEQVGEYAPDSGIRFINAGVGGTGLADWLAFLETYHDELPIDGILFVHNYDDFARTLAKNLYVLDDAGVLQESRRWRERSIKKTLDESRLWKQLQENARLFSFMQSLFWSKVYFEDLYEQNSTVINPYSGFETMTDYHAYALELMPHIYERLARFSAEQQLPLWISTTGFIGKEESDAVNEVVFSELPEIIANAGLYYEDITPELNARIAGNYDAIRIPEDTHPNAAGAALIGELLWERSGETILKHFSPPLSRN
ncbi:MAG: hypothetical protein ACOC2C_00125 [Cyclonatronaceae bacterium]